MEQEIWKDVIGYEGFYEVSNLGNVRSVERFVKTSRGSALRKSPARNLKKVPSPEYYRISLCKFGVIKDMAVHRLVAEAFIPNPENKPYVDHIDGNMQNNLVTNLRWASAYENVMNPNTHYKTIGINHFNYKTKYSDDFKQKLRKGHHKEHKAIDQYTKDGEFIKQYESILEAERQTGIDNSAISACCRHLKNHKSAGGYYWEYAVNGNQYIVYKHTCPNGKVYIGQTCRTVYSRSGIHGVHYKQCKLFYRAILKYKWNNIKHDILFDGLTREEAGIIEQEQITLYKSTDHQFGYNIQKGGRIAI